jgi:hypothetical protein
LVSLSFTGYSTRAYNTGMHAHGKLAPSNTKHSDSEFRNVKYLGNLWLNEG